MSMVRATKASELLVQSLLIGAALIYGPGPAFAHPQQEPPPDRVGGAPTQDEEATAKPQIPQTPPAPVPTPADQTRDNSEGKKTKRMLWVVPNSAAVDANKQLPPMSTREKFVLAAKDSVVDYSSYTWAGVLAGQAMALNSDPELGHGIPGYGRYYWRTFTDGVSGTFFTVTIVPAISPCDPRSSNMEKGGFFRRTGYAISRAFVTKTDSG